MLRVSSHIQKISTVENSLTKTRHDAFTQLMDDGHATSAEACNAHFKELIFPILTHTRALPHFYFTQHYAKLRDTTLHTDIKFIQILYNMFTRAFFALPTQITLMCNDISNTDVTLPLLEQQKHTSTQQLQTSHGTSQSYKNF